MCKSLFIHLKIDNYSLRKSRVEYGSWREALAATKDTVWDELGTRVSLVVEEVLLADKYFWDDCFICFYEFYLKEILGDDCVELNYDRIWLLLL